MVVKLTMYVPGSNLGPKPLPPPPHGDLRGGRLHCEYCKKKIIIQAYKNHWVLRTSPDDWFFPVIRRIAQAGQHHRRRMEREAKAKVVASVWGANLLNSLLR